MRAARRGGEDGYSLVELLVVIVILGIIGSILLSVMLSAFRTQRIQVAYVDALNTAKVAMERVTRDVRGANPLEVADVDGIEVTLVEGGVAKTRSWMLDTGASSSVLYRCTTTLATCTAATGQRVVGGLSADAGYQLFRYYDVDGNELTAVPLSLSDREAVTDVVIDIVVPLVNGDAVELDNAISIRNAGS